MDRDFEVLEELRVNGGAICKMSQNMYHLELDTGLRLYAAFLVEVSLLS